MIFIVNDLTQYFTMYASNDSVILFGWGVGEFKKNVGLTSFVTK